MQYEIRGPHHHKYKHPSQQSSVTYQIRKTVNHLSAFSESRHQQPENWHTGKSYQNNTGGITYPGSLLDPQNGHIQD